MNFSDYGIPGVEVKEIPCIKGKGAPTVNTKGAVGALYMDTDNGKIYKCISGFDGVYIWVADDALIGDLSQLETEAKESLVAAVNEVMKKSGGTADPAEVERIVLEYLQEYPVSGSGVYVGVDEPADPNINVWINPEDKETPDIPIVYEWAKQPRKPVYTAQEVGALPADTVIPAVPNTLPNPHPLTFTGAATGSYDGSEAVAIDIPAGGGGGSSGIPFNGDWGDPVATFTLEEEVYEFVISQTDDGRNIADLGAKEMLVAYTGAYSSTAIYEQPVSICFGDKYINGIDVTIPRGASNTANKWYAWMYAQYGGVAAHDAAPQHAKCYIFYDVINTTTRLSGYSKIQRGDAASGLIVRGNKADQMLGVGTTVAIWVR